VGADLGLGCPGAGLEAGAGRLPGPVDDDGPDARVGVRDRATRGEREGGTHRSEVAFGVAVLHVDIPPARA